MTDKELQKKMFGKEIKDMDILETLAAISAVGNRLHKATGETRYKNVEKAALAALNGEEKGYDKNLIVSDMLNSAETPTEQTKFRFKMNIS